MIPQNESNATGSMKVFPAAGKIPQGDFWCCFRRHSTVPDS
jgi:hypothetical protein